jgi:hypothetical protein
VQSSLPDITQQVATFGRNQNDLSMTNPLHLAPVDTPAIVYEVTSALALWILPSAFLLICLTMALSRTEKSPYFPVFCIFGSMGAFCLTIYFSNGPISVLGFLIAFVVSPILLVHNWFRLRTTARNSICHRMVQWASLTPLVILIFFVVWHPAEDKKQEAEQIAPSNR